MTSLLLALVTVLGSLGLMKAKTPAGWAMKENTDKKTVYTLASGSTVEITADTNSDYLTYTAAGMQGEANEEAQLLCRKTGEDQQNFSHPETASARYGRATSEWPSYVCDTGA